MRFGSGGAMSAYVVNDEFDPLIPQLRWVVVTHSLDHLESSPGNQFGGSSSAADVDERVAIAMHHKSRNGDMPKPICPASRCTHGKVLTTGTGRMEAAVECPLGIGAPTGLIGERRTTPFV